MDGDGPAQRLLCSLRMGDREYDVIVFGATGFTGRRTAEYLARHAPNELKWAIAGRNRGKLEGLKTALISVNDHCRNVGLVEASVDDEPSLARAAERTRVLLTTVGPFSDHGEPVVRACIAAGTDYVDSTGEAQFVDMLARRYAGEAAKKGVRLVPSSGFDAAVADLGAFYTVLRLPEGEPIRLSGYVSLRAVFSGGTERSAIKSMGAAPPLLEASVGSGGADMPRVAAPGERSGEPTRRVREVPARSGGRPEFAGFAMPFPTIDASVVVRSARAVERYGPDFTYAHHAVHPTWFHAVLALLIFGTAAYLARFAPFRAFFLALAKKPGEGPTETQMDRNWFKTRFIAECGGKTLQTEVSGGDPAYRETAKLLAESAMCLALDRASLPDRVGLLTPVAAMGERLLERAERGGIRFATLVP